jgi:hypothetical protein
MFEQWVLDLWVRESNEKNIIPNVNKLTTLVNNQVSRLTSPEWEELKLCPHCQENTMYDNKCTECGLWKWEDFCKKLAENKRSDLEDFWYLCENEHKLMNQNTLIYVFYNLFKFYSLDIKTSSNNKLNLINLAVKDNNWLIYRIKLELSLKINSCKILNITSNSQDSNDKSTHLRKILKSNLKLIINESYINNWLDVIQEEYKKYKLSSIYDYTINWTWNSHTINYLKYPGALKSTNWTIHLELSKEVFTCNFDYKLSHSRWDIESKNVYLTRYEISIKWKSDKETKELIDWTVLNHLKTVILWIINNPQYNPDLED